VSGFDAFDQVTNNGRSKDRNSMRNPQGQWQSLRSSQPQSNFASKGSTYAGRDWQAPEERRQWNSHERAERAGSREPWRPRPPVPRNSFAEQPSEPRRPTDQRLRGSQHTAPRQPRPTRDAARGVPSTAHGDTSGVIAVDGDDAEDFAGRHRRGDKKLSSSEERRRARFALDDEDVVKIDDKKNKKKQSTRRDALELEMEAIEAALYQPESSVSEKKKKKDEKPAEPVRPRVEIPSYMSVQNLAVALNLRVNAFVEKLEEEGYEDAGPDHILDASTSAMFAELYGFEPVMTRARVANDLVARPPADDPSSLPPRPPIVTIMGHVDHGKTTILDWLRKSSVVAGEHGGITQHIGAFSVAMPVTKRKITFLDTPGHAAFLDMRRRGAVVTDIVVLVVAADDSVKPQTIEAIRHATEANVQIIVAINKIDKQDANVQQVWQDLARYEVNVEDYGGDVQAIPLSGKTGQGMDALEEAIITLADVSDFRAEADGPAEGWIIESKVTAGGRVATVLVRRGTLRPGDYIVAGSTWARVRTLRNDAGELVTQAPPGTPVQIDGWRGADPTAGLEVLQADDEQQAKAVVELREEKEEAVRAAIDTVAINKSKAEEAEAYSKVRAWREEQGYVGKKLRKMPRGAIGWVEGETGSGPTRVPFVIKADVAGSAEAIAAAVSAIGNKEVEADVIHSGTGMLNESDIRLLATTGETGYAISFNQPVDATMYRLAEAADLQILDHNIIYKVTDVVREKLADELPPTITQRVLGEAEVGKIFDITVKKKTIKIAGCNVTNGVISRSQKIRVLRNAEVIYTGRGPQLLLCFGY
jgi:translation initiation factor IF-2